MSGIAGIYSLDGGHVDRHALDAMARVVQYRGQDGMGQWVGRQVGLAHLRLCTTPESAEEHQPLPSPDGACVIVWDGRLDNREMLIDKLASVGVQCPDATDAALVLEAYAAWGTECAKHVVGDFAFAVWDEKARRLYCARDPAGMKPLHYYWDGRTFIFGTEIKQVCQHPGVPKKLNEFMVGLYLCGDFGDGEMTFYEGIKRLPGGCQAVVSQDGVKVTRFWDPDPYDTIQFPSELDYVERFRELLLDAVRSRLRGNRGVEVLLSGGVDSGSIASVAGLLNRRQRAGGARLTALSFVHAAAPMDETPYAGLICREYGIPLATLSVDECWMLKPAPTDGLQDEPFVLPYEAMQAKALQDAHDRDVNVVLTGEGGDETAMYGNMVYLQDWMREFHLRSIWQDLSAGTPDYRRAGLSVIRRSLMPRWVRHVTRRQEAHIPGWIQAGFAHRHRLAGWLEAAKPHSRRTGAFLQQRGRNPVLLGGDIRCARYGIEWRHPFYDSRIVEFLVRIPPTVRFQGGREKALLRKVMAGILPEAVRRRRHYGAFGPLFEQGLKHAEVSRLESLLDGSLLERIGIIDAAAVKRTYEAYVAGDNAKCARLFWTFATEAWLRQAFPGLGEQGSLWVPAEAAR